MQVLLSTRPSVQCTYICLFVHKKFSHLNEIGVLVEVDECCMTRSKFKVKVTEAKSCKNG